MIDSYPSSISAVYVAIGKTPDRPRLVCPHCGNQLTIILPMLPEDFKDLLIGQESGLPLFEL